jgi:hypothetical protein
LFLINSNTLIFVDSIWDDGYKHTVKRIEEGDVMIKELAAMVHERADLEKKVDCA